MRAPADFAYVLPDSLSSAAAAPLLCAGTLHAAALKTCSLTSLQNATLWQRINLCSNNSIICAHLLYTLLLGFVCVEPGKQRNEIINSCG
jgi:hypothetical protein